VSIQELAEKMLAQVGRAGDANGVRFVPYEEAYPNGDFEDIRDRMPCIDRIHEATGWKPRRSLDEIISDVVAYKTAGELAPADIVAVPAFA
jgi:UDP-glucose 4-epimerase